LTVEKPKPTTPKTMSAASLAALTAQVKAERDKQSDLQAKLDAAKKQHREYTRLQNKIAPLEHELAELTRFNARIESEIASLTDIVSGALQDPRIEEMELKVSRARLRSIHLTHEWDGREQRRMAQLLKLEQEQRELEQYNKEMEAKLLEYERL